MKILKLIVSMAFVLFFAGLFSPKLQAATQPAALEGEKTAEAQASNVYEDLYKICLEIRGQRETTTAEEYIPIDVVLVLDLSTSVDTNNRWIPEKNALNIIIRTLLEDEGSENADIRVGMVGFGSGASAIMGAPVRQKAHKTLHDFTDNAGSLRSVYNGTSTASALHPASIGGVKLLGGTNSEAGFIGGWLMLNGRTESEKEDRMGIMIYLTDGATTYGYTQADEVNDIYYEEINTSDVRARAKAESIKAAGYTIYSVGLDLMADDAAKTLLESAASTITENGNGQPPTSRKLVYYASSANLSNVFADIGTDIRSRIIESEHSSVELVDQMSPYVTFINDGTYDPLIEYSTDNGATYSPVLPAEYELDYDASGDGTLSLVLNPFNSDYLYRISYYIQVKEECAGMAIHKDQTSGLTPEEGDDGVIANGHTYLQSNLSNETEVLVPTVYKDYVTIPFSFYKIDGTGGTYEGQKLSGAAFELKYCKNSIFSSHVHSADLSCFETVGTEYGSDAAGLVNLGDLKNGTYLLIETEAPFGYSKPLSGWFLQVSTKKELNITAGTSGSDIPPAFFYVDDTYYLSNMKIITLPFTGGIKGIMDLATGFLLIALLVGVLIYTRWEGHHDGTKK